jgi:hypothetical protein
MLSSLDLCCERYCEEDNLVDLMRYTVKATIASALVFGISICLFCATQSVAKTRLKVTVLENTPTTSTYEWDEPGHASSSCYGSSCSAHYYPPNSGTASIHGAILKLLLPDARIVVAECAFKSTLSAYRDCRIPTADESIEAEFDGDSVKLFMQAPSIDGTGKISHETYKIRGILKPTDESEIEQQVVSDPGLEKQLIENTKSGNQSEAGLAAQIALGHAPTDAEKAHASRCILLTKPSGAAVYIDGNLAGSSPLAFALLPHGNAYRVITVRMKGYKTVESKFIPDGRDIPLNLTLVADQH